MKVGNTLGPIYSFNIYKVFLPELIFAELFHSLVSLNKLYTHSAL